MVHLTFVMNQTKKDNFLDFLAVKATTDLLVQLDIRDPIRGLNTTPELMMEFLGDEIVRSGLVYLIRNTPGLLR